eukprot:1602323-Pyramimonas_sp.AAC.1
MVLRALPLRGRPTSRDLISQSLQGRAAARAHIGSACCVPGWLLPALAMAGRGPAPRRGLMMERGRAGP